MSENITLEVSKRQQCGKNESRRARRKGLVPGIIYGGKSSPINILLDSKTTTQHLYKGEITGAVIHLNIDNKVEKVLLKNFQTHPVKGQPIHFDFFRVKQDSRIKLEIPVNVINQETCIGLKRGGALTIIRHTIECECPASNIPENLIADINNLDIGDSLHSSDIVYPAKVTPVIEDRDFTIASISGASQNASATGEEEEKEEEEAN